MKLTFHIWRQKDAKSPGQMVRYESDNFNEDMSMLEALDVLNEELMNRGELPVAFEHDCREGICGSCGFMINGVAHGPVPATTVCQLTLRHFQDGEELYLEPWRARAFPILKDLVVDRNAFDRVIQAGGYISVSTGSAPDGNAIPIRKENADRAMDYASCIACGACVAACPNASAALFTGAKISHLRQLPQGEPERHERALRMVAQVNAEMFGNCTNIGECAAVCPKEIPLEVIAQMNRDFLAASWAARKQPYQDPAEEKRWQQYDSAHR
ncbi:MAG: succinate dehydrogenase/fumarate reductase iron-sulfur subunit [Bryobacteraceae bacterium]|nr:succinate dehydrogenase/fumarate reductase iron-sulfur subunit [Bryobacteraceae bacterium]